MPSYILTGTPGAGKTAILRQLELNGHLVVEEAATDVIALENARGHATPWHEPAFLDKIVTLQRHRQARLQAADDAMIFFDRSPVCTLVLSHYLGFAPSRLVAEEVDRVVAQGIYESRLHEQIYRDLGFRLAELPAGPLTDRVSLVQQTIEHLQS